ncbi:protein osteopotentia [Echinococcus multilocularis]|uniref:Protein osteopotentia n=1 Tax=Echinococcus multilocularis TaxID=6211 RepID=A0A068Y1K6_ECHMU|nr:protein osteopotentia [Echinococcus multilocularis]
MLKLHKTSPSPVIVEGKPALGDISAPKVVLTSQPSPPRDEAVLPPMDESVVNELSQPNMPTFQEFHAKVLGENQNKRRLDSSDDPGSLLSGQSVKDILGSTTHSNLSKHPNRNDEGITHTPSAPATTNTEAATSILSPPGTDTATASETIYPSSVLENGGNGGTTSKRGHDTAQELRVMRNIAASECGAKLLQASPSAKHAPAILVDNNDEYMNQPCSSEKWFIIETCEPVQLGIIQIANYELFSSRCKTFRVFVSDRYPAKQWEQIGIFRGQDVKGLQTFHIGGSATGRLIKYVKFEMLDHYGNEHFCPITMVRLFGLSSDEMDEPELPPPPLSRSSPSGNSGTTLGESEDGLNGNANTSLLGKTHLEVSIEPQSSAKVTSTTASKKPSGEKKFKRNKMSKIELDSPVNSSSVEEDKSEDCAKGERDKVRAAAHSFKSTGLWQHAARFILGVLQSAIGGESSLMLPQASATAPVKRTDSLTTVEPTSDDFYSVIYIFSASSSSVATPPPSTDARSRGLWHLAHCLLALSSSPSLRSLAAPHRAWADCTASEFLLNLTTTSSRGSTESLLQFQRLAAAYQNLTSAFGRWPAVLMRRQMGKELPVPEFLKPRVAPKFVVLPPSNSLVGNSETLEQETVKLGTNETEQPPPVESKLTSPPSPTQPSPTSLMSPSDSAVESYEKEAVEDENSSPQSPPPSSSIQHASSKEGDDKNIPMVEDAKVISGTPASAEPPWKQEPKAEVAMTEGREGEREVVLPAAMGGSWKENMYMRLNNKVLQLQSDVSVSMRYLEELSQSYKRQTERLSASFNLTTAWLKATAKGAEERDLLQQERIDALEAQLTKLLHILAERGVVVLDRSPRNLASTTTTTTSSTVPHFRKPDSYSASSTAGVDLQSILWSVFFQSPATATRSSSLSTSSKRVYGSSSTSAAAAASRTDSGARGGIESCNTTSVLSLFRLPSATPGSPRPSAVGARIVPPAALLFRRRQLRGPEEAEAGVDANRPTTHLPGVDGAWIFVLAVALQQLRNFLLSETFRLWLLHLCLAVLAQTFVYVVFMRSALRCCLPLSPLALSPSSCKICSTFPTTENSNCNRTDQGAGAFADEKEAIQPRSRSSSSSASPPKNRPSLPLSDLPSVKMRILGVDAEGLRKSAATATIIIIIIAPITVGTTTNNNNTTIPVTHHSPTGNTYSTAKQRGHLLQRRTKSYFCNHELSFLSTVPSDRPVAVAACVERVGDSHYRGWPLSVHHRTSSLKQCAWQVSQAHLSDVIWSLCGTAKSWFTRSENRWARLSSRQVINPPSSSDQLQLLARIQLEVCLPRLLEPVVDGSTVIIAFEMSFVIGYSMSSPLTSGLLSALEMSETESVDIATLPLPQIQEIAKQFEQKLQYINASLQQLRVLQGQFASSRDCLKNFNVENKDKNTLIPLTSTLCVPGRLIDPTCVLVDIGTGYFVEMKVEEASKHFTKRIEFIEKQIEKIAPVLAQKTQEHRTIMGVFEAKAKALMKAQGVQ